MIGLWWIGWSLYGSSRFFPLQRLDIAIVVSTASSSTWTRFKLCVWLNEAPWFLGLVVAWDGNWLEKDTCLPFLLSVVGWTFVLTKFVFLPCVNSSASFASLVTRSLRGSSLMLVWFGVGIACKLVVVSAGEMTNAFDLCKVVDVVADCCMMKDRVDHCSSYILHTTKDCYWKQGYYNNSSMDPKNLVVPVESITNRDCEVVENTWSIVKINTKLTNFRK